jgi:hypothetical protein
VEVVAHQHDRHVSADRVEHAAGRGVGPEGVLEAVADQRLTEGRRIDAEPLADERRRLGRRRRAREVEATPGQRPLIHVHVRVPEPRGEPASVEVDDLGAGPRRDVTGDRRHLARLDEHIDKRAVAADEAGVPQEQAPLLLGSVGGHRSRTRRISAARAGCA